MATPVQLDNDVMTLKEAASYLKVSRMTLIRWVRDRQIPGRKQGTIYLFHRGQLERWVMGDVSSSGAALTGENL